MIYPKSISLSLRPTIQVTAVACFIFAGLLPGEARSFTPKDNADLLNFCPPVALQKAVAARNGTGGLKFAFHAIDRAKGGEETNVDSYRVKVTSMPKLPNTAQPMTPEALFDHLRGHLGDLIDATNSEFRPYDGTADKTTWSKADPTGAIMLFDILNKFGAVPVKNKSDRIERALVVASDIKRSADLYYWRFSTLGANDEWKPDFSAYGDHPVSGTREFGLYKSGTVWVAYTRGADRATGGFIDYWSRNDIFKGADDLWKSFQTRFAKFVKDNGGAAEVLPPERQEPLWSDLVKDNIVHVSCNWQAGAVKP